MRDKKTPNGASGRPKHERTKKQKTRKKGSLTRERQEDSRRRFGKTKTRASYVRDKKTPNGASGRPKHELRTKKQKARKKGLLTRGRQKDSKRRFGKTKTRASYVRDKKTPNGASGRPKHELRTKKQRARKKGSLTRERQEDSRRRFGKTKARASYVRDKNTPNCASGRPKHELRTKKQKARKKGSLTRERQEDSRRRFGKTKTRDSYVRDKKTPNGASGRPKHELRTRKQKARKKGSLTREGQEDSRRRFGKTKTRASYVRDKKTPNCASGRPKHELRKKKQKARKKVH